MKGEMDWQCCDRCQKFTNCKTNWYRGEKGLPRICCSECQNFPDCYNKWKQSRYEEEKFIVTLH